MKTFTYSILCILLFIMYACTPFEEVNPVLINNESDIKDRCRLVIAAGLNVKTNTPNYQIHEQGEGEWELEP